MASQELIHSQSVSSTQVMLQSSSNANPSLEPTTGPAEQAPVVPPQEQEREQDFQQRNAELLASYGIKVRDFAHENTLPPVAPVRVLPRQTQPDPRRQPMKRLWKGEDEDEDEDELSQLDTPADNRKKSKVVREPTEPVIPNTSGRPMRARGFTDLDDYAEHADSQQLIPQSQQSDWSSQPPLLYDYGESQQSEPYIATPTVTPNGSLRWAQGNGSASTPEPLSLSQKHLLAKEGMPGKADLSPPSPIDGSRASPSSSRELPVRRSTPLKPSPSSSRHSSPRGANSSKPTRRYHLRTRKPTQASSFTPKPPLRGRRIGHSRGGGSTSRHGRGKTTSSSNAKMLRKRGAGSGQEDG